MKKGSICKMKKVPIKFAKRPKRKKKNAIGYMIKILLGI